MQKGEGKGISKGSQAAHEEKYTLKVMDPTMKGKDYSISITNPLISLRDVAPTKEKVVVCKEIYAYIEFYPRLEFPKLPPRKLLNHFTLVQKALNASLGMMEDLHLLNVDLEDEN